MTIESLNSLILPDTVDAIRNARLNRLGLSDKQVAEVDQKTLFYDAIHTGDGWICLVCPKIIGLKKIVDDGAFFVSGTRQQPRIRNFGGRFDEIWLKSKHKPSSLSFQHGAFRADIPLSDRDLGTFRGLRCAVLRSKNNELTWIRDWVIYHIAVHGLQGVLFFDNNSSLYSITELHDLLLGIPGLKEVILISAIFPFGRTLKDDSQQMHSTKYLTPGLLNIARLRYMQPAAAVLLIDIDELAAPVDNGTVFDLARKSSVGYVSFCGSWRYPVTPLPEEIRHHHHVYMNCPSGRIHARKYCINPAGPLRRFRWNTHGLLFPLPFKRLIKRLFTTRAVEYWHFRKISTFWKSDRKLPDPGRLVKDPLIENALSFTISKDAPRENSS